MKKQLEVIENTISDLGEGPVWLANEGVFYWVDIMEKQIRFYKPDTGKQWSIQTPDYIGAAVPAGKGRLICAMGSGFYHLDMDTQTFEEIATPESHLPGNRFNDGKCDREGRFWAGTLSMTSEPEAGALYCLERDGSVRHMLSQIGCSNGLGWNSDDSVMYYIDTYTHEVHRFSYDAATGEISNREAIIRFSKEQGYPDGMTVDAEGMIWVAHWGGYGVSRWNPETGEQLDMIELPVSQVTSCCFGGDNLDELFITSARTGLSEQQLLEEPLAGSCFLYKPGVRGLQVEEYKPLG